MDRLPPTLLITALRHRHMANLPRRNSLQKKRRKLREELWPGERAWLSEEEKGFFLAPRTLPLILMILDRKAVSKALAPSSVYLELLSRHRGDGIIEFGYEEEHAAAAGYTGTQAKKSWRNRMKILEQHGFIKVKRSLGRQFGYGLIVHPTIAVYNLHDAGLVPDDLWDNYRTQQINAGELPIEDLRGTVEE